MIDEILEKIEKKANLPKAEILEKIDQKYVELDGLITREGAAYLVARDFGINLPTAVKRLQMKNVIPGMKNINVSGRIFRISSVNDFVKMDGTKGKVVNLFLSDGTGFLRIPLWNEQVDMITNETVKLGDTVQITNGMSRENIFGDVEISLGKFGGIRQIEDTFEFPSENDLSKRFLSISSERVLLKDIIPGNFEIKGTIANVFKGNFLFNTCPICSSSLEGNKCSEHGIVDPNHALVLSCIADDDTGDIRTVFFRDLAEKLSNMSSQELSLLEPEERYEKISGNLLGRELVISGKVRKNKMFDRLEMMANDFKDINVLEESNKLADEIELRAGM
jgi:ssDNA-binding replication factor A large subunit